MVEVNNNFIQECEANVGTYKFGKIKVNYIDDNPLNYEQGAYSSSNGAKIDAEQSIRYNKLVECKPNFKYKIELGNSAYKMKIVTYNANQAFIAAHDNLAEGSELTTEATAKYISVTIYSNDTLEGANITLNNTIKNGEIAGIELQGNTTQNGTPTPNAPVAVNNVTGEQVVRVCGKNLMKLNLITTPTTYSGVTFTPNDDGTITLNGTATSTRWVDLSNIDYGSTGFNLGGVTNTIKSLTGNNYTMSAKITNEKVNVNYNANNKFTSCYIYKDTNYNNAILQIQLEKGSSATSYEPYQGKDYEINLGKSIYEGSSDLYGNIREYNQFTREDLGENVLKLTKTTSGSTSPRFFVSLVQGKTYSVQLKAKGNCTKIEVGTWVDNTQTTQANIVPNENDFTTMSFTFTYSGSNPRIYIRNNDTNIPLNTYIIIKDFMIEEGSQVTSYAPYFTPIELNKIGNYQDFIKKGTGKNLADTEKVNLGYSLDNSGNLSVSPTRSTIFQIAVKPSTNYSLSVANNYQIGNLFYYKEDKTLLSMVSSGWENNKVITTPSGAYYISFATRVSTNATMVESDLTNLHIQIEENSNVTYYEPFGYKDKWYIEKNVEKIQFNGTENWHLQSSGTYYKYQWSNALPNKYNVANTPLFCSHFKQITVAQGDTKNVIGIANGVYNGYSIAIVTNITTLASFKTWLETNRPEVTYALANPTYTLIENEELIEQLDAVSHAETQEGITNITSSGILPATLKVKPDLTESIRGKQTTPIVGYNITGDDDLINFKITSKADSNGNILGATSQSQVDIEIFNENNTHNLENKQVYISTGLNETEGNYCKWQPFTITQTKDTQTKNHTTYTGYDDMMRGNEAYVDNIDYGENGITLYDFTCKLAKEMGMALGNTTMTNGDFIVKGNNFTNNETKLIVLKNIAQMVGGFAMIDRDNLLRIVELSPEDAMTPIELTTNLYTEDFQNSAKFGEINELAIGETNIETNAIVRSDNASIAKNGVKKIEILDNIFLGLLEDKETAIEPLWDAFNGFSYYPFKTPYNGYPYIDLGDKINITDINSNVYRTLVLNNVFEYNGGYKGNIGAEALSITAAKYKTTNTLSKQFRKVGIDIDRVEGEITAEIAAREDTTEQLSQLSQTVNEINSTVSTTTTTVSDLETRVQTNETSISQNSDSITATVTRVQKTEDDVETLQTNTEDVVNQLVFGDDGLTISAKGSTSDDMKLNLTNDAIKFLYNNNAVLTINGSVIEFSNASFKKLDLGNYVWQAEDDDSLSLIYEGGN